MTDVFNSQEKELQFLLAALLNTDGAKQPRNDSEVQNLAAVATAYWLGEIVGALRIANDRYRWPK